MNLYAKIVQIAPGIAYKECGFDKKNLEAVSDPDTTQALRKMSEVVMKPVRTH